MIVDKSGIVDVACFSRRFGYDEGRVVDVVER